MKKNIHKSCKRRKCPYYNIYSEKCGKCDWNPDGYWQHERTADQSPLPRPEVIFDAG